MNSNEILRILYGSLALAFGGVVVIFGFLNSLPLMLACLSITLGILSLYLVFDARVEREKRIQEELRRKLTMIKLENDTNLELLKILKERVDKLFPKELENKRKKISSKDLKKIINGGLWIQKRHCLYHFALQVVEIGHHFENETFIETIKEYAQKLDRLNQLKDFIQMWIVVRKQYLNRDEMHDLRTRINEADKISNELKVMIATEIKHRDIK